MEKLNEKIKFSIVIPCFNRAGFIKATIESVLNQDYSNFEIIIIDDGSIDNTDEVVNSIADPRIKYFKKTNGERGAARNYGLRKASGEYVFFLDSDDFMHINHLSTLCQMITTLNGNVNFITVKYDFNCNGIRKKSSIQKLSEGWYTNDLLLIGNFFGCLFCIKKNNPDLKLFVEDRRYAIMEDWLFIMQNLINDRIYIIDKITISINDHDGRSMRGDNEIIINKKMLANDWLIQNIPLTIKQQKILLAHTYYFCAIHAYIDNSRKKALNYLKKGISENGCKRKEVVLLIKILFGVKIISKIAAFFKN